MRQLLLFCCLCAFIVSLLLFSGCQAASPERRAFQIETAVVDSVLVAKKSWASYVRIKLVDLRHRRKDLGQDVQADLDELNRRNKRVREAYNHYQLSMKLADGLAEGAFTQTNSAGAYDVAFKAVEAAIVEFTFVVQEMQK